jgi:hypothetical protein
MTLAPRTSAERDARVLLEGLADLPPTDRAASASPCRSAQCERGSSPCRGLAD